MVHSGLSNRSHPNVNSAYAMCACQQGYRVAAMPGYRHACGAPETASGAFSGLGGCLFWRGGAPGTACKAVSAPFLGDFRRRVGFIRACSPKCSPPRARYVVASAGGGALGAAGGPFAGGRHGPDSEPSMRATRSVKACRSPRSFADVGADLPAQLGDLGAKYAIIAMSPHQRAACGRPPSSFVAAGCNRCIRMPEPCAARRQEPGVVAAFACCHTYPPTIRATYHGRAHMRQSHAKAHADNRAPPKATYLS